MSIADFEVKCLFNYEDAGGILIAQKLRYEPKAFRQRQRVFNPSEYPDAVYDEAEKVWWSKKVDDEIKCLPYRLPELNTAIEDRAEYIYACEGESDAEAVIAAGSPATTILQIGYWEGWAEYFRGYRGTVLVVVDNDGPGAAQALAKRTALRAVGCKVELRKPRKYKDVREHLENGGQLSNLAAVTVKTLKAKAEEYKPVSDSNGLDQNGYPLWLQGIHDVRANGPARARFVVRGSEDDPDAEDLDHGLKVITGSAVKRGRVRYALNGRIVIGGINLVPGEEGIGKSTVIADWAAQMTRGVLEGEWSGKARDVIIVAAEDSIADVVEPRMEAAGADHTRWHAVEARIGEDGSERELIVPRDLWRLERLVRLRNAGMLWIDSLVTTMPDDAKTVSYKDTAKILKRLGEFAEKMDIAVVAPWHLNKTAGNDTAMRMMDSRAFRTAVRSVVMVVSDPDNPGEGLVAIDKANAGKLDAPTLRYRIDSHYYTVEEADPGTGEVVEKQASCGRVAWLGTVDGDARQIVRGMLTPEKMTEAAVWLRDYLKANGETERKKVMEDGKEEDFTEGQLKTARRRLSVVVNNTHEVPRRTLWKLP